MTSYKASIAVFASLALVSCGSNETVAGSAPDADRPSAAEGASPSLATRPSGEPNLVTKEGRIESGVECPVLHTPDGEIWALSLGEADFGPGDYVSVTGEVADASICMQGEGTILPQTIDAKDPPARDRDPARAGGIAVTSEYVVGSWVAKGAGADCSQPDFRVTTNANGLALFKGMVNGKQQTAALSVGGDPAIHYDAPLKSTPVETRGPDGLAILPPASGAISIAGHPIEGDGVVFVKCG